MFEIIEKTKNTLKFVYRGVEYNGDYKEGDDAIYVRLNDDMGLKIINPSDRYQSQSDTLETLKLFKEREYDFFPKIFDIVMVGELILLEVEHISQTTTPKFKQDWLTTDDKTYLSEYFVSTDLETLTDISYKLLQEGLLPEDEWHKQGRNIIGDKIVDFHRFVYFTDRYKIPTDADSDTINQVYNDALKRYADMGINKWKGKIYEGFRFNTGDEMIGYSSDYKEYDSYRKLNFFPMNKCSGGKVLDIGCNEGFLSTQSALHCAESVYGFDITAQDIELANDIKNKITKLDNVSYGVGDAVKFMSENTEQFDVVILSSVLHQIYPHMKGAESFLENISKNTKYMAYETPVKHPLMKLSLREIEHTLRKYFNHCRLGYVYNAYSSGYRAVFVCHN